MGQLKELLLKDPALRKLTRKEGSPIFVTMDTNMTDIGWVINQENEDGRRYVIRFGAKVLNKRQRKYAQVNDVVKIRQRYVNLRRDPGASDQRISNSCVLSI